jgi:5S rRNA maturation endonuclease (ribonuclease M5)
VVLHCHAGCRTEDVIAHLELGWADLFPEDRNGKAEIVATYDYTDEQGRLLYQAVRYFPKGFKRRRADGNGGWIWSLKDTRLVLYRLPQVLAAVEAGQPVYVVEGEKDVHAVERAGATATTNLGGADGTWPPSFSRLLAKTKVMVVADNDHSGRKRARRIAASIHEHGGQVEVARPVPDHDKADAADHLNAGYGLDAFLPLDQQPETGPAEDGAALLDQVADLLARYIAFPSPAARDAVALWAAHCHAVTAFESTARLALLSAEKGSGKTRTLEVLELLVPRPMHAVNATAAAVFRAVEAHQPTLLFDEADSYFGPMAKGSTRSCVAWSTRATARARSPTAASATRPICRSRRSRPIARSPSPVSATCPPPSWTGRCWSECAAGRPPR